MKRAPYDHFGVVVRGREIIHFAPAGTDDPRDMQTIRSEAAHLMRDTGDIVTGHMHVRQTPPEHFLRDSTEFWIMKIPGEAAARRILRTRIDGILQPAATKFKGLLGTLINNGIDKERDKALSSMLQNYHLYTLAETQERARSRLGEADYNFATNNCEHFAFWCRTGLSTSQQLDGLLFGGVSLAAAIFTSSFSSRLKQVFDPTQWESLAGQGLFTKSPPIPVAALLRPRRRQPTSEHPRQG